MPSLSYPAHTRNSSRSRPNLGHKPAPMPTFTRPPKRYYVPGTEGSDQPLTAAFGFFDDWILRSVRSSAGIRFDADALNFLISILDAAESDGMDSIEVVIRFRRSKTEVTFATDFETFRAHGQRVAGFSGPELSLPLGHWSIDGRPPAGPKPPRPEQPALFDFAEPAKRIGGY